MIRGSRQYGHSNPAVRELWKLQDLVEEHDVPQEICERINRVLKLTLDRDTYCENLTTQASADVGTIIDKTTVYPWKKALEEKAIIARLAPRMVSGNIEAQLLKCIIDMSGARTALEIGTFTGCATLAMAEAVPADGRVVTLEIDPFVVDMARSFFDNSPHGKKIEIKLGRALDSLNSLAENGEQFDVVFIDADKPGYIDYYKTLFEKNLLSPTGTIVVDNVLYEGYPYAPGDIQHGINIKQFNDMVIKDDSVHRVVLSCLDGVMIIRRKINGNEVHNPADPS